jgi:enamine deaminase RidA (YjgF/YER057c/UK114 family)
MPTIEFLNPDGLSKPATEYKQVSIASAQRFAFIAGQVASDASGTVIGKGDFEAQCLQVFANIEAALRGAGADWSHIVQFTTYFTRRQDMAAYRAIRAREFPKRFKDGRYPPNTAILAAGLANEDYLLEIQVIAALG